MSSKLRAILRDPILFLLVAALLVQSYRVVDEHQRQRDRMLLTTFLSPEPGKFMFGSGTGFRVDGVAWVLSNQNELKISFTVPLGPDGRPIDAQALSQQDSESLEQVYLRTKFALNADHPRTLKARANYAANLLYRGDRDEALRLLRRNFDAAVDARNMALDERVNLLLFSARELRDVEDGKHRDRVNQLIDLMRKHYEESPQQVARILNAVAFLQMEKGSSHTLASVFLNMAEDLPLDRNTDKLTIIETGLGLAVVRYRDGSWQRARDEARRQLSNVRSLRDEELRPARETYLNALRVIFEKLGDDEYVGITEGLLADES
jgi:hypothetical protein